MRKTIIFMGLLSIVAGKAQAECDLSPNRGGDPSTFTIPENTITVDANLPASTTNPIATYDSRSQGYEMAYVECVLGTPYGRTAVSLAEVDASGIYKTNIDGIGVKVLWRNATSGGFLQFPAIRAVEQYEVGDDNTASIKFDSNSHFRLEFYKTSESLRLNNTSGETVLSPSTLGYFWIKTNSLASAAQTIATEQIKIISTPNCTHTSNETVDFGLVTSNTLAASGIEKPLPFELICRTDYGSYSATATLSTTTPSGDNSYIKVKDADGNDDRMGIKIRDSHGNDIKVDGSVDERISNVTSAIPAKFSWVATLIPTSTIHPANGDFSAQAEITLQLR